MPGVIVAADGNDGTRELVRELAERDTAIRAIGSPERGGKGKGIREAVAIATGTIIGFVDADNKVPISELENIETWLRQGYDIAIGSRALASSQVEQTAKDEPVTSSSRTATLRMGEVVARPAPVEEPRVTESSPVKLGPLGRTTAG